MGITSISGREHLLVDSVNSLLSGEYIPFKIIISLPYVYKNHKNEINIKLVQSLAKHKNVVILRDIQDFGPITKFLGVINFIEKEKNIIPNKTFIVCCDDDLNYKQDALKIMVNQIMKNNYLACSFYTYINLINICRVGQGADMFAVRFDITKGLHQFYNTVVLNNKLLFYHDDLVVSVFLKHNKIKLEKINYPSGTCYVHVNHNISALAKLTGNKSRKNLNIQLVIENSNFYSKIFLIISKIFLIINNKLDELFKIFIK